MRILLILLCFISPAFALDTEQEARAHRLSAEIRCLTCTAQNIADSDALLAQDLRQFVRTEIESGKSDAAIKEELRIRYGDQILMSPPLRTDTGLLWLGPLLLLLVAGFAARKFVGRK